MPSAMTKEKDAKEPHDAHRFDIRVLERNLKRGLISRKEYEKYIKSLADAKDKIKPPEV
jgi:hypothetical protein